MVWHAVNGKQSVAAAHFRPNGIAADDPVGDGPDDLGGIAGVAGPKILIFDVLAPWDPRKVKTICFQTLSFILFQSPPELTSDSTFSLVPCSSSPSRNFFVFLRSRFSENLQF